MGYLKKEEETKVSVRVRYKPIIEIHPTHFTFSFPTQTITFLITHSLKVS
jgi:competence transcription factor ComK